MSIIKAFNTHFIEFLDDVLTVFPDDKNVKTSKYSMKCVLNALIILIIN